MSKEYVVLLHGLARTRSSMKKMASCLVEQGYEVINRGYHSRTDTIENLAAAVIPEAICECEQGGAERIHFVTHSMGGILVRYYLANNSIHNLGRVVMLSPPNQGSELVDGLKPLPGYSLVNGPAGYQLGTDDNSIPRQLGPANFDVGIITGSRSINLFLSLFIPGANDGKVSVENARLEGMADFLVLPYTHPFIMKRRIVIEQAMYFLRHGKFQK